MYRLTFLILLTLGLATFSYAQTQSITEEATPEWRTLAKDKFEIRYPSDWDLDESGTMGTSFILFAKPEDEDDKFRENVNLLIQDVAGYNMDLDKYVTITEQQINTVVEGGEIILSERISEENNSYQKMIYSGMQGPFSLQFEQYFWIIGEKAIIVTLTCETDQFEKYRVIGEQILNSFVLK